ncbi:interferon alpha/beta receptor 2-like isoform X1 [Seriola lalandi dorsalis]|uniref:Interferon alpha/beta receptor 2-like n=1 Tax=Seriola lalandi dorsalis TaxID=1841481 RepID=A0A3B4WM33_SERLL|nr:interferon alpha/beta receptor 2-like isoform X1 [Seriola lalandi dorsalis]XP_056244588.1 interferon alpha/beta receptor 2-like isoform X2 [Seriola aureovittata]
MELWMLLLLHLQLANAPWIEDVAVSLPAPSNVSISSFNMEHTLSFLPGARTPSNTHFSVQIIRQRKSSWRPVVGCLELKAAQMCNLTTAFKDPYTQYRARVQAFTATQASNWTVSGWFQPLSDTVLGPPGVSVSGCGNCLILQLRLPVTRGGQQNLQLENLYRTVELHVQRTRDETQFRLSLPYKEETVITYLQPGVEYCVTITVTTYFSSNSVSSRPYCAFTSPPPPTTSAYLVFGLLGASCMLVLFFIGLMVHGGWLSSSRTLLQNEDSTNWLLTAHSPTPPLRSCSAGGEDDCED